MVGEREYHERRQCRQTFRPHSSSAPPPARLPCNAVVSGSSPPPRGTSQGPLCWASRAGRPIPDAAQASGLSAATKAPPARQRSVFLMKAATLLSRAEGRSAANTGATASPGRAIHCPPRGARTPAVAARASGLPVRRANRRQAAPRASPIRMCRFGASGPNSTEPSTGKAGRSTSCCGRTAVSPLPKPSPGRPRRRIMATARGRPRWTEMSRAVGRYGCCAVRPCFGVTSRFEPTTT